MRRFSLFAPLAAVMFLACQQQAAEQAATEEPAMDTAAAEQAILDLANGYEQAVGAKDVEAVTNMWTGDVLFAEHDGTTISGSDGMRAFYTQIFSAPGTIAEDINPEKTVVSSAGDIAYQYGTYTVTMTGEDGQSASETHRYVVTLRNENGAWKLSGGMGSAALSEGGSGSTP